MFKTVTIKPGQHVTYRGGFNTTVVGRVDTVCPNTNLVVTALYTIKDGQQVEISATTNRTGIIITRECILGVE